MIQTGSTTQLGLYEFKGEVAKAIEQFENTGGMISRATLVELNATTPEYDYQLARVDATGDEYRWNPALTTTVKWEPTGRNFLSESKAYSDSKADAAEANAISVAANNAEQKITESLVPINSKLNQAKTDIAKNGFLPTALRKPIFIGENGKAILTTDENGNLNFEAEQYSFKLGFGSKPLIFIGDDNREILLNPDQDYVTRSQLESAVSSSVKQEDQKLAGYGLIDFFEAIRSRANSASRLNIFMYGDSLTQGSDGVSIPDEIYRIAGKRMGYGGVGFVPFNASTIATYGKGSGNNVFFFTNNGWQGWNYFNGTPTFNGWQGWGIKGGMYADSSVTGQIAISMHGDYRGKDMYEYDTARLFYFAVGGDVTFTVNGVSVTATAVADATNPTVSYVDVTGLGKNTGLYSVAVQRTSGSGVLHLGGIDFINSLGGISLHRIAIGGYKAADQTGQSAQAQKTYLSAIGCDLAIINLGQNDNATASATWKAQMQEIINRIRADSTTRPILLVKWYTDIVWNKSTVLQELANENDIQIIDVRNIIPSAQWTIDKKINLSNSLTDPHLKRNGSTYVARYFLKHLNFESITENLRSV